MRPTRPAGRQRLLLVLLVLATSALGGCRKVPAGRDAVMATELQGVPKKHRGEIKDGLSTRKTDKLLGFIPRVLEYRVLNREALEKDLERIARQLRRRGYYEARVSAARVIRLDEDKVRVEIAVTLGEQVFISRVRTEGLAQLPFDAAEHATRALKLRSGDVFDEDEYEKGKLDIANSLADVGYAHVRVAGRAQVDLTNHTAEVTMTVNPGPRAVFGPITIEGLEEIPEGPVRSNLLLQPGKRYSRKELEDARGALFRLGVFSRVDIVPVLDDRTAKVVPIRVQVEESALRSVTAGGGGSLDVLRLAAHARVGWTHRNFLGGLRKFSASTRPGLTFFPTRIDNLVAPTNVLPENSLSVSLEQPSFIEGRTKGFIDTGYNIYPLLYPLPEGVDPNLETVVGYNEITAAAGVERPFVSGKLPITLSMNWRSNFPFTYQGEKVDGLETVIVSYPELVTLYDFRDDPIAPTAGFVISNSFQVALPIMGGLVTDVRFRPQVSTYLPLNFSRTLVLASRFGIGMTFPQDYGDALINAGADLDYTDPDIIRDQHKLLFRAFYSGGPNSNRGYPYQRIGPQGPIGFLVPSGVDCSGAIDTLDSTCIRPLGGFTLWEASMEVRWNAAGPWGFVFFADASDVSSKVATFTFGEPHISIGPGVRYASPVGPIRIDVGWRVPGLQKFVDNPDEPPDISDVEPYASEEWYEAFALHILIGEAF